MTYDSFTKVKTICLFEDRPADDESPETAAKAISGR